MLMPGVCYRYLIHVIGREGNAVIDPSHLPISASVEERKMHITYIYKCGQWKLILKTSI